MVFPLYDDNPFKRAAPPYVTWSLIAINILIFLILLGADAATQNTVNLTYGVMPSLMFHNYQLPSGLPAEASLISSCFLHRDAGHLLGNMIFLWVFGDDIEDALGRFRFLLFYMLCGIAGGLAYYVLDINSTTPLIGASGAVSGILAAYLLLRPCAPVSVFVLRFIIRVSAYWVIGGWMLLQLFLLEAGSQDGTAYIAHIGGAVAGALLLLVMRPANVALFECIEQPDQEEPRSSAKSVPTERQSEPRYERDGKIVV
jgi:membrane associated rhomboid family serine protease